MPIRLHGLDELAAVEGALHLALGVFDGVHAGHREVIGRAVDAARRGGGKALVVTFSPHPIRVIAPGKAPAALLATLEEKAEVVGEMGVDGLVVIEFDEDFARMNAEEFVRRISAGDVRMIAVGGDWKFGSGRRGDVEVLRAMGKDLGFALEAVPPVMWEGERISSTRIRQAIRDGNFEEVEKMLGRPYAVSGMVIEGRKLGRELGFPTANIDLGDLQTPREGVWAVEVEAFGKGVANLGHRPTVRGSGRLLEVHLLDFNGDLYGKTIKVRFGEFLRAEKTFNTLDELKLQISRDVEAVRG